MVQVLDTRVCSSSTRIVVGNACRSREAVYQLSAPKLNLYHPYRLFRTHGLHNSVFGESPDVLERV